MPWGPTVPDLEPGWYEAWLTQKTEEAESRAFAREFAAGILYAIDHDDEETLRRFVYDALDQRYTLTVEEKTKIFDEVREDQTRSGDG